MTDADQSSQFCRELVRKGFEPGLKYRPRRIRHEVGDRIRVSVWDPAAETAGNATLLLERFAGGGFAGQVYRCIVTELDLDGGSIAGLARGSRYAVKLLIPPSRGSNWFRNFIFWLGYQGPFSAQVHKEAAMSALLWQRLVRRCAKHVFGRDDCIAATYALVRDPVLGAYGEINEWVEGRTWHLEPDTRPWLRRGWRSAEPEETGSPEFVAKRQFMDRLVRLLTDMGGVEFARQYSWWTMKSQPNVLKRAGCDDDPAGGLCAIDFRAGLALLPFLPMSPGDIPLILRGLRHGRLVQFNRIDLPMLRAYIEAAPDAKGLIPLLERLEASERVARRVVPDVTHQAGTLLVNDGLRRDVRWGLVAGYLSRQLVDENFAEQLATGSTRCFALYYLLGAIPVLGDFARRYWGNAEYRGHLHGFFSDRAYFRSACTAGVARRLAEWIRRGRAGEGRARFLLAHPAFFWLQRLTLGFLPAGLHRYIAEPSFAIARIREGWTFVRQFYRDESFREQWLRGIVEDAHKEGTLDAAEREVILSYVNDPFIVRYLRAVAVHFATLPVTQIVSVIVGAVVAGMKLASGADWEVAALCFAGIIVVFQLTPISPGSIVRGIYAVSLMIRDRDVRSYRVAAPISFLKYLGYLAFPIQMATTYPELARLMASRWATGAVHIVPVFGEKGALLEHGVFDACFNIPRVIADWAARRPRLALELWMLGGTLLYMAFVRGCADMGGIAQVNLLLAYIVLFAAPRVVGVLALARRGKAEPEPTES